MLGGGDRALRKGGGIWGENLKPSCQGSVSVNRMRGVVDLD